MRKPASGHVNQIIGGGGGGGCPEEMNASRIEFGGRARRY